MLLQVIGEIAQLLLGIRGRYFSIPAEMLISATRPDQQPKTYGLTIVKP